MSLRALYNAPPPKRKATPAPVLPACVHRGYIVGTVERSCCGAIPTRACAVHGLCVQTRDQLGHLRNAQNGTTARACEGCQSFAPLIPGVDTSRWLRPIEPPEGAVETIPVTIGIPVAGQVDLLRHVIALHRLQRGVMPRFILADTLTPARELHDLHELAEAPDVTLLTVPHRKWRHTSQPVCDAMQMIWDACSTAVLVQTHTDCFPASLWSVYDLARQCSEVDAVGYQMSPRRDGRDDDPIWRWSETLSHTLTAFARDRIGNLNHDMEAAAIAAGDHAGYLNYHGGLPDTENGFSWFMRQAGHTVRMLGPEQNQTLDKTAHYWHARSATCAALHSENYYRQSQAIRDEAVAAAVQWVAEWAK